MKWVKTLVWAVVFVLVVLFCVQNQDRVTLHYSLYLANYNWEVPDVPVFLLVLCSVLLGILIAGAGALYDHFLLKRGLRRQRETIARLEKQIESVRAPGADRPPVSKDS